jgi:tetratricopeptide (TPR) repeat protein
VGRLVNGSFRRQGQTLDVQVEILDDKGFAVHLPLRFSRPDNELLTLQKEIARAVGAALGNAPAEAAVSPETSTAQSELANRLVLFGIHAEREVKDEIAVDQAKLEEAIGYYRKAIETDPTSLAAQSHLAAALLYLGDFETARSAVEAMVSLATANGSQATAAELSDAYYTFGLYLWRTESKGVETAYEKAVQLNPSNVDAIGAYALWLMMRPEVAGNAEKARAYFREAIRLDVRSLSRYGDYAEYLAIREDVDGLRVLASTIEKLFPNERGYLKLARVHDLMGELDVGIAFGLKVYRVLREAGSAAPPQLLVDARGQIGELYARIGEFETARAFDPEPALYQLFFERRYDELATLAQDVLIDDPEDGDPVNFLTFAYNETEDYRTTRDYLKALKYPRRSITESGGADAWPNMNYAQAVKALGADLGTMERLIGSDVTDFERGEENGQRPWGALVVLACGQALLERYADALDSLDLLNNALGLAWLPQVEDQPCFAPLTKEPRYLAVVQHLKDRQRELRERLPATLKEYGVADVQP